MKIQDLQDEHHAMEDVERRKGKLWSEIPSFTVWLIARMERAEAQVLLLEAQRDGKRTSAMPFPVFNLGPDGETHYMTYHRGFKDGWTTARKDT